ncbi:CPBP family intramembrane glutamic endopeptidase [Caulobacter henricii]|uniref:CAAX protease n=1 Tax=Caulobacter henricii TaxID=69395 RepID=A0A0P0NVK1_9CAUL|nr:CPBP family intramembrane glutamic endopeptidase [Caulobacter henricii]ALL12067.1 CAAX protease [Caulobacter henricii]
MAMGVIFEAMRESRFFADLTPRDRDGRLVALTLPVGLLAGFVAALLGAALACLIVMVVVSGLDGAPTAAALFAVFDDPERATTEGMSSLFLLSVLAGANGAAALAFIGVAGGLMHRPIRLYAAGAPLLRTRLILAGLVMVGTVMIVLVLAAGLLGAEPPRPPVLDLASTSLGRATYVAFAIALLVIAAAAEEVVFRGWLLKQCGAFTRNPLILMTVNGLVFAAIHFDPSPGAFLIRAAMGAGLTWMTLRTGGIELAIGAHAANNIIILLLIRPLSLTPETAQPLQAAALIGALGLGVGYALLAEAVVRWPAITRAFGGSSPATS